MTTVCRIILKKHESTFFLIGSIQLFDLTTAIELCSTSDLNSLSISSSSFHHHNGGPSAADLLKMLDHCDFAATVVNIKISYPHVVQHRVVRVLIYQYQQATILLL